MTIDSRYLSASVLIVFTAYGLTPLITGQPLSYWIARALDRVTCFERACWRTLFPAVAMLRHAYREELMRVERRTA